MPVRFFYEVIGNACRKRTEVRKVQKNHFSNQGKIISGRPTNTKFVLVNRHEFETGDARA